MITRREFNKLAVLGVGAVALGIPAITSPVSLPRDLAGDDHIMYDPIYLGSPITLDYQGNIKLAKQGDVTMGIADHKIVADFDVKMFKMTAQSKKKAKGY